MARQSRHVRALDDKIAEQETALLTEEAAVASRQIVIRELRAVRNAFTVAEGKRKRKPGPVAAPKASAPAVDVKPN